MTSTRDPRRHLLPLLLALSLLVAAACGSDDDTSTAAGDTATSAPADTGCDASDPLKIGVSNTLSGPSAEIGKITQQGFDLAAEELNDTGGVLGRCVELVVKDDGGEPTKAAQVVRELIDQEGVEAILGPFLSSAMGATMEITTQAEMVQIVLGTLPEAGDASTYPYVFRPENPSSGQAPAIAAFLERSGFERPAILGVNNGLGQGLVPVLEAELADRGIEVASIEYHEAGLVDMTPHVRKLVDASPDVLVLITIGTDAVTALRARGSLAPDLPVVGLGVIADQATIDAVGTENMDNVFAGPTYRAITRKPGSDELLTETATTFRDAYSSFVGSDDLKVNIQQPAAAYDDLMMLAAAIEAAGEVDADAIRAHLEEVGHDGVRGSYRFTHDNHDGVDWRDTVFVAAKTLQHGTLELAPGEESGGSGG